MTRYRWNDAATLCVIAILAVSLLYPLGRLLAVALSAGNGFPPSGFFWRILAFTYGQALLSAAGSAVVGVAGAFLLTESRFAGRRWWRRLSLVTFSLPAIVVALALAEFWGRQGWPAALGVSWRGGIYGWPGILLAHVFFNFPLFVKNVGRALAEMDRAPEKAALSLGAGRWRCFWSVSWPKVRPAFVGSFLLAFLYCAGSFLIVMLLGGGPRFTTLEIAVYQAVRADFDPVTAARLAWVQLAAAAIAYRFLFRERPLPGARRYGGDGLYRFRSEASNRAARYAYATVLFVLAGGPLLVILRDATVGWRDADWPELAAAAFSSVQLAVTAALLACSLALTLAYAVRHARRRASGGALSVLAHLPLCVSPLVLTLSWLLAYSSWLWQWRGSMLAIAAAQGVVALPLAYRPLQEALARISPALYRSAASLGAGPWRIWCAVEMPLLGRALGVAFLFVVAYSLGELGAVLVFIDDKFQPLALLIFRQMSRYRFQQAAVASAVLLLLVTAVQLAWGEREDWMA